MPPSTDMNLKTEEWFIPHNTTGFFFKGTLGVPLFLLFLIMYLCISVCISVGEFRGQRSWIPWS